MAFAEWYTAFLTTTELSARLSVCWHEMSRGELCSLGDACYERLQSKLVTESVCANKSGANWRLWIISFISPESHRNIESLPCSLFWWDGVVLFLPSPFNLFDCNGERVRLADTEKRGKDGKQKARACAFRQVRPKQAIQGPFQRSNGRWALTDSSCGLLINPEEAIGEPPSTCSKLNKASPEMALFSLVFLPLSLVLSNPPSILIKWNTKEDPSSGNWY